MKNKFRVVRMERTYPLTGEKWVQFYVEKNVGVFCEHWKMCTGHWKRDIFDTLEEAMERYNKLAATDTITVVYPIKNVNS